MTLHITAQLSGEVVPARAQMATTLGFHIILACLGIALPTFVLLAEFIGLRRRNETALLLARRWSQAMGVLIAVGAVTGTVLSFEMGLLWPGLMRQYGAGARVPVRRRRALLLPRGDLRRGVPVGLAAAAGVGALVVRSADRGVWHLRRDVGDRRELVDEPAGRLHGKRRPDHLGEPVAGVLQPRRPLRDAAHDPGRVHGRRVPRRRRVRGRHPARPPRPLPLRRASPSGSCLPRS